MGCIGDAYISINYTLYFSRACYFSAWKIAVLGISICEILVDAYLYLVKFRLNGMHIYISKHIIGYFPSDPVGHKA